MPYPPNIIEVFRQASQFETHRMGTVIMREGEPGSVMYVVKEGEVELRVGGRFLALISPGGIIGEMALIDRQARSATAVARTDCKLVPMDRELFLFILRQTPAFALDVMHIMSERLRHMDHLTTLREPSA